MRLEKKLLVLTILFLSIGFAAVSTTLFFSGTINIETNESDFDVYFSDAIIDEEQDLNVIGQDKKTINFSTKNLFQIGDKTILEYEVTNASTQYDANVSVVCAPTETDLYKVTNSLDKEIIEARSVGIGQVIVELKKKVIDEQNINFTCTLNASAVESTTLKTGPIKGRCEYEEGKEWLFNYSGEEEELPIACTGEYKFEVWGASGGDETVVYRGGFGGYSTGTIKLKRDQIIYINVGGVGGNYSTSSSAGGYNGGGLGVGGSSSGTPTYATGGGGATHIASESGLLNTFQNKISSLYIVAGGGGGAAWWKKDNSFWSGVGGSGGGYKGTDASPTIANSGGYPKGLGGTQTTGYAFGQGSTGIANTAGGGGGLYGGMGGTWTASGGGSGYIGNPLLYDKSMYCYGCAESTEESTFTRTVSVYSTLPESKKAKDGHGYAKITYLG